LKFGTFDYAIPPTHDKVGGRRKMGWAWAGVWVKLSSRVLFTLHAKLSGAVYCYRSCLCVCVFATGGRCPNLTTASARTVFASLWALFSFHLL